MKIKESIIIFITVVLIALEVLLGVYLFKDDSSINMDLFALEVDGKKSIKVPTKDFYYMTSDCNNMEVKWDIGLKRIISKISNIDQVNKTKCTLSFNKIAKGIINITVVDGSVYSEKKYYGIESINCPNANVETKSGKLSIISTGVLTTCDIVLNNSFVDEFNYIDSYQEYSVPKTGYYEVELWGAQGGGNTTGGYGAYTKGTVYLEKNEIIYVYIGNQPARTENSFNGGGQTNNTHYPTDDGGGATDIRLVGDSWDNASSLNSRIMVAGAGGGSEGYSSGAQGASAGGLFGYSGSYTGSIGSYQVPTGGTQFSGGLKDTSPSSGENGAFGKGGNGELAYGGGGGGSGWYGGGGGSNASHVSSGGGGSSFISGHRGCVAIDSTGAVRKDSTGTTLCNSSSSDGYNASGYNTNISCSKHYSNKVFTDTLMIDGAGQKWDASTGSLVKTTEAMPNPTGGYYASGVGHTGNGYARITYIGSTISTIMTLASASGTLYVGGDNNTIAINGEDYGTLSCTSSNISVATCSINNASLKVTPGTASGSSTITVYESNANKTAIYNVVVKEVTLSLLETTGSMSIGNTKNVSILGENYGTLSCESSNETIAVCDVNAEELVINTKSTGGNVTVTLRENNADKTASIYLNVSETTLALLSKSGSFYAGGNAKTVTISGTNMGTLSCLSTNNNIASCSISGTTLTVTPGTVGGTATITVTENNENKSDTYTSNVTATSIALSSTSGTIYIAGANKTSTISGTNMGTLSCSSTSNSIASCSISGTTLTIIPGTIGGTATITVMESNGNASATYSVNVLAVTLNLSTYSGTITLNETNAVTMASGTNIGAPLTCTPTNSSIVSCKVSSNVITITGKTSGSTTVVIREPNAGKTATYNIRVNEPEPEEVYASWCEVQLDVPYIDTSERSGESFEEIIEDFCMEACRDYTGTMCWGAGGSNPGFYNGVWDSYCSWGGNNYYVECGAAD